jgi:zinc and cadmium transporter
MTVYIYTLGSVIIVSLISFAGALALVISPEKLKKITVLLVGLSAGALLGDAFLHLLPETVEGANGRNGVWLWVLGGIIIFFILEKIIYWRHCHIPTTEDHPHPFGFMNLIGDGLHNFLDGVIIAGSFLANPALGAATTIAVIAHEIPQEISDLGVLLHAGFSKTKALLLNFLSAVIAIIGALIAIFIGAKIGGFINFIVPFTAGGFIYIATADLIPELQKEAKPSASLWQLASILAGIGIMLGLKIVME